MNLIDYLHSEIFSMKHAIARFLKSIIYYNGEEYQFGGQKLKFVANTRPVKRSYINHNSDVVRNDVLQIIYLEEQLKPEHVLWDVGSHHGHYSIFAGSVAATNNQVFSFEPDRKARLIQESNILLNNFSQKIKLFDTVISDKEGEISFMDLGGNSNSHIVKNDSKESNVVKKKTTSLNLLLHSLPKPDFVKIDTEGAEIDILRGGSELLQDKSIRFICELHPFAWDDFGVKFDEFMQLLQESGRKIELLDPNYNMQDLPYYGTVLF